MMMMKVMDDDDSDYDYDNSDLNNDRDDDDDYISDDDHPYLVSFHHLQENPTYHTGGLKHILNVN